MPVTGSYSAPRVRHFSSLISIGVCVLFIWMLINFEPLDREPSIFSPTIVKKFLYPHLELFFAGHGHIIYVCMQKKAYDLSVSQATPEEPWCDARLRGSSPKPASPPMAYLGSPLIMLFLRGRRAPLGSMPEGGRCGAVNSGSVKSFYRATSFYSKETPLRGFLAAAVQWASV